MPGLWVAIRATLSYFAIVGIGVVYMWQVANVSYGTVAMVSRYWTVEAILSVLCLYYIFRYFGWSGVGFGKLNWRALLWFLPSYLVLGALVAPIIPKLLDGSLGAADWRLLGLLTVTTFLIGFSEEVMFRGILLRGALARLPVLQAMLLSAVAFSLLHAFSLFGGQLALLTFQQLGFTLMIGIALAPLALKIGNLWPLIIWHWLWDLALFSGSLLNMIHPFALLGILSQVMVSLVLWKRIVRQD